MGERNAEAFSLRNGLVVIWRINKSRFSFEVEVIFSHPFAECSDFFLIWGTRKLCIKLSYIQKGEKAPILSVVIYLGFSWVDTQWIMNWFVFLKSSSDFQSTGLLLRADEDGIKSKLSTLTNSELNFHFNVPFKVLAFLNKFQMVFN